jgi:homoserine kinase type II
VHEDQSLRERFESHELAIVLSYYDLGAIEQLRAYPRGSRKSPKLRIRAKRGEFLLKRRAAGQDDPYRVAFAHDLQLHLAQRAYPVPGLIGTRGDNNSMLQMNGRTYELFNYVHGTRYDSTGRSAHQVGDMLGVFHALMSNYRSTYEPQVGSFHGAPEIDAKTSLIASAVHAVEPHADQQAVKQTAEYLRRAYRDAAQRVDELGFRIWPKKVVHGDWHPGNLLFREGRIVGVLDFDSSRIEPRVVDVANAALQFSMQMTDPDQPANWPDSLDHGVIRCILRGYDEASGQPLSVEERQSVPWLMIEALIIESIVPIAATGSFARIAGSAFLEMIQRKVKWIRPRALRLAEAV